jgi:hypothetical protein
MRPSLVVMAVVCLVPGAALAQDEASSKPTHDLLERRVYLPSLLGYGVGTSPLGLGPAAVGFATFPTGVVSYVGADSTSGGASAHSDSFSFNPNVDVRAGRFTLGGGVSVAYTRSSQGASQAETTSFELAPRVGYLVPIARSFLLWPRVSAGFLVGGVSATGYPSSSVTGFVASADLLLVAELGPHFFLTAGPSGWFDAAAAGAGSSSSFGLGASIGLGVAL